MTIKKMTFVIMAMTLVFLLALSFRFSQMKNIDTPVVIKAGKTELRLAGSFTSPSKTPLKNPIDLAVSKSGEIYVTDSDHHRIQVFSDKGKFLFSFGGSGSAKGQLNYPVSVAIDKNKKVYVAELYNQRISVFSSKGKFEHFIKAIGEGGARVTPTAMDVDPEGNLYVIDKVDNTVKKLNSEGEILFTFGSLGREEGEFQYPLGVAVNEKGHVIVADTGNNRIQVLDQEGRLLKIIPVPLGPPSGVEADGENKIYYTEPTNGQVAVIENSKEKPTVLIKSSDVDKEGIFFPEGVDFANGSLYLTDKGINRILVFDITSK